MAERGEQPYQSDALGQLQRARAARRGVAVAGAVIALLGPAVVWLRVARGVPFGAWGVPCVVAVLVCAGAVVLARRGRTRRGLGLIVGGVVLVLAGDLLATATVS
ncbi:hypothetical protein QIS99_20950 [Streptomyces sp. B-S-A8]|uniref:Uncharacterized protein n=1 Tax=Streptomyces solicavernae TaxID=3043614 RepID=A0ABT6RW39_9ACTN|nr:hypothetical protein [Streptomyces sp. B-S-A8]MDI3388654.1 hypothetical protein [Streptomyces sp. B-S-A8]